MRESVMHDPVFTPISMSYFCSELSQKPSLLVVNVYGILNEGSLEVLKGHMRGLEVNQFPFSTVSRPTTGIRRTSIWGIRVRDNVV